MKKQLYATGLLLALHFTSFSQKCTPFPLNAANQVAYYNFTGGSLMDMTGNGHNGMPMGGALPTTDAYGNPNCAYAFNGSPGDYIQIPSSPDFDFAGHPATISVWYRPQETTPGKFELLVGRDLGGHCPNMSGDYSVALYDCRRPVGGINLSSNWYSYLPPTCSSYFIAAGWQHVVVVFDWGSGGSIQPVQIYWNNILTSAPSSGGCPPPLVPTINAGDLYIGTDFLGSIDDVRIYDMAFSSSDVAALYSYGIMGCCAPIQTRSSTRKADLAGSAADLKAYPNPVTKAMEIEIPERFINGKLVIYNSVGQAVMEQHIKTAHEQLDMQQLPAGIYWIECTSGDERSRLKVVKQ